LIAEYMEITEIDRPSIMELIDSIEISEGRRASDYRMQEVAFHQNLLQDAKKDIA